MLDKKRDQILHEERFLTMAKRDDWYEFIHNKKGRGQGVVVLVYDFSDPKVPRLLGRYEHTPCHVEGHVPSENKNLLLTSITGQYDKPEKSLAEHALEELSEEAGIEATLEELEDLGKIYPSKFSDSLVSIYALDGSNKELGEAKGDGSKGEEGSFVKWGTARFIIENGNCPMIGMAYSRLVSKKFPASLQL